MRIRLVMGALLLLGGARTTAAQDLANRLAASQGDRVTFTFAGRPGVCGDGTNFDLGGVRQSDGDDRYCRPGPVRVTLDRSGSTVTRIRTTVGGLPPADITDLGEVPPAQAADWLLALAAKGEGRASEEAIMPAAVARDVVAWPRLAALAKDQDLREGTRKQAIFWLGQAAAEEAIGPLDDLVNDDPDHEVREAALFALSQQRTDHAIDVLIRVARTNSDRRLRRSAFFWLGQSGDPRGIKLFEEVLAGR